MDHYLLKINMIDLDAKYDFIDSRFYEGVMHYHDAYEIMFQIKSDNNKMFIKDTCYIIESNQIIFIAPFTIHTIMYNEGTEYQRIGLHIEKEFVEELLKPYDCLEVLKLFNSGGEKESVNVMNLDFRCFTAVHRSFSKLLEKHKSYVERKDKYSFIQLKLAIVSFFVDIYGTLNNFALKKTVAIRDDVITEIISFLDENYKDSITLDIISQKFNFSKFYITKIFKQTTGATIIEYLQYRRVIEAQRMMGASDASVTDICYTCGFNSIQNFYKVFKKITNSTPGTWYSQTKQEHNPPVAPEDTD